MKYLVWCLLPLTSILFITVVQAQNAVLAYFTADNFTPLVGERIIVTLIVEVPLNFEIVGWPDFPSDQYPFEILETHDRTEQTRDENHFLQQTFTMVIWRPGEFRTPDLLLTYHDIENDETHSVPIEPVFFNVPTQLTGGDDSLRPFKPQIYLPYLSPFAVVGIAALFGGAGWFSYRQWQQRQTHRPAQQAEITTPYNTAIAALTHLEQHTPESKIAYPQIVDCLRTYIHEQFDIATQELTTTELLDTLSQHPAGLQPGLLRDLQRLLQQADLVKFAGIMPEDNTVGRLLKFARNWLTTADQHMVEGDAV